MYRINLGLMISTDDLRFFVTLAASRSLAAAVALLNVTSPSTPISVFEGQREYNPRLGRSYRLDTLSLHGTTRQPPLSCQSQIAMAVVEWPRGWLPLSGISSAPAMLTLAFLSFL